MKIAQHKPLKKLPDIVAFDTEDDSSGNPKSVSFYCGEGKVYTFYTMEEGRDFIYSKAGKCIFVAHNLEYDLVNLYRDIGFEEIEELQYTAKLISAKIKGKKHRFIDSFSFFQFSLKKMGEIIGVEKLAFDPDSREYAERDPEIVWKTMAKFQEILYKHYDLDLPNTIGSLAMRIFTEKYLEKEYEGFNEKIALDAFYGGRCEVFYKGAVNREICESDINSEYPTAMTKEFPDTNTIQKVNSINYRFGVAKCRVFAPKMKFPVLPYRVDGKLLFPVGTFTGTWTFHEIKEAAKRGYKILEIYEAYGTDQGCFPFKDFVHEHYQLRIEAKDEMYKLFYKILLNNAYGKLVMHKDRCVITNGEMTFSEMEKSGAELVTNYGDIYIYKVETKTPPPNANYLWGAYVTSYGRIMLLENLEIADKTSTVCYCDTDSVITFGDIPKLDFHKTKLGALKNEKWDFGHFYMPKGYVLVRQDKKKITCKGIPQPESVQGKELTLENPRMQFLELGRAEFRKPVKLRQSFPQKKKANVWELVTKERRLVSSKRVERGEGPTSPIEICEPT